MKDKYIGKVGTQEQDKYKYELRTDVLGKMIKPARQERNLTQEELENVLEFRKLKSPNLKVVPLLLSLILY